MNYEDADDLHLPDGMDWSVPQPEEEDDLYLPASIDWSIAQPAEADELNLPDDLDWSMAQPEDGGDLNLPEGTDWSIGQSAEDAPAPNTLPLYNISDPIYPTQGPFEYNAQHALLNWPLSALNQPECASTSRVSEPWSYPDTFHTDTMNIPTSQPDYTSSASSTYRETEVFDYPDSYDPRLPRYRLCHFHPLWQVPGGRAYVYEYNTTPDIQRSQSDWAADLKVPLGLSGEELARDCWLELFPGDIIFVREKGATDPMLDIPKAWVTGPERLGCLDRIKAIAAKILGDREDRTLNRPTTINGVKKGGIKFERNPNLINTSQGLRCYSTTISVQVPRDQLGQPSHNAAEAGEYGDLLREFNYASAEVAAAALNDGPAKHRDMCQLRSDLLNLPEIGVPTNRGYFSSCQINVAPSVLHSSRSDMSGALGNAGISHWDKMDDSLGHTGMYSISDIPRNYHPGRFCLLELHAFTTMTNYNVVVFSGLQRHGGTPPQAPRGATSVVPWALRVTNIWYPSRPFLSRRGNTSFAYTEEFGVVENSTKGTGWRPTFAECGLNIMQASSLRSYVTKELYFLTHCILKNCPPSLHLNVDATKFLDSFSYTDDDGAVHSVPAWDLAPGGPRDDERAALLQKVEEYKAHVASFIPLMSAKLEKQSKKKSRTNHASSSHTTTVIRRPRRHVPALREHLTAALIHSTLEELHNALAATGSHQLTLENVMEIDYMVEDLRDVTTLLKRDSRDVNICASLHTLWQNYDLLAQGSAELTLRLKINRIQLMCMTWFTWRWIYEDCAAHVRCFLQLVDTENLAFGPLSWLYRLTNRISNHYLKQTPRRLKLNPYEFLPRSMTNLCFINLPSATRKYASQEEMMNHILECLVYWIGPPELNFYTRGAIVDSIMRVVGRMGILAVDPTWKAYDDPWGYGFGDAKKKKSVQENMRCFEEGLSDMFGNEVREDLHDLTNIIADFCPDFVAHANFLNRPSLTSQPVNPARVESTSSSTSSSSSSSESSSSTSNSSPSTLDSTTLNPNLPLLRTELAQYRTKLIRAAERIVLLLKYASLFIQGRNSSTNAISQFFSRCGIPDGKEPLKKGTNSLDGYFPIRENAPSRKKILMSPSPFEHQHVRTRAGFFSAVIFRGVTFDTSFLQGKDKHLFESLVDYRTTISKHATKDKKYLCNTAAYGATYGRSTENASKFWEASKQWEPFLAHHPHLNFHDLFHWICSLESMPTIGPLNAYLLTCDFAYAKVVPMPSSREVGIALASIQKGALNCLEKEFHLPHSNLIECFEALYDFVNAMLSASQVDEIGYNPIVLEHTLCKMRKLGRTDTVRSILFDGLS